jgi:hypothetical protein
VDTFAEIPDESAADTPATVPAPSPAPRHREGTGHLAELIDLTPADLASQVTLAHILDVTTSFDGLCSLLENARLLNELSDVEGVRICLGQANRVARLLGGERA